MATYRIDDTEGAEKQTIPLGLFTHAKNNGEYGCPALRETEAHLAKEADNPTALLCLADFFLDGFSVDRQPPREDLGGTQSLFPGGPYERMQAYESVLASPKASADNKAYALYRSVKCYAPSGYSGCGGKDVPVAQRKAWFLRLKREYPSSRWARELKYYW